MKLLLDTHILLWWFADDPKLTPSALRAIAARANVVQISVVSLWEIVIKARRKKLGVEIAELEEAVTQAGFKRLSITASHLVTLAGLAALHGDPFDQLLIAQAISEEATLITVDREMRRYPVRLLD